MRIVQLANFVSPTSGGIRTTMTHLRHGYRSAGHDTVVVTPGPSSTRTDTATGPAVTIRAPRIPRTGGYRMITDLGAVQRVLEDLAPDRVEVNDRFTLRSIGGWARANAVPSVLVVHERLDRLAELYLPWVTRPALVARWDNRSVADGFDTVVSPSRWGAQEFSRAGVDNVNVVGWGVDSDVFHPDRRSKVLRRRLLDGCTVLLAMACRLSPEKQPASAIAALVALRATGVDARLVIAGTGASERAVRKAATGHPVTFLGHLHGRDHVAELLAAADLTICPGPLETFGLAALESMACGTPVLSSQSGAVPELLQPSYGRSSYNRGTLMASAATDLLAGGDAARQAAREAAVTHSWQRPIDQMLTLHGAGGSAARRGDLGPGPSGHAVVASPTVDRATGPVTAAVVGRYAGVVDVLAQILTAGGVTVTLTWSADGEPGATMPPAMQDGGPMVVVTVGPGDTTLAALRTAGLTAAVAAVVWHPDEEIGPIPGPHHLVRAGQIRATLVGVVRDMGSG